MSPHFRIIPVSCHKQRYSVWIGLHQDVQEQMTMALNHRFTPLLSIWPGLLREAGGLAPAFSLRGTHDQRAIPGWNPCTGGEHVNQRGTLWPVQETRRGAQVARYDGTPQRVRVPNSVSYPGGLASRPPALVGLLFRR